MNRIQHKGLHLGRPEAGTEAAGWMMPVLAAAAVYALMELTGVEEPWLPALAGGAVCAAGRVLRRSQWFGAGGLAVLVLALLIQRGRLPDGFCQWFNSVGAVYTGERGIVLPALEATGDSRNILLFACWSAAAAALGLSLLLRWGTEAGATVVLILCGGASLVLGRLIDPLLLILSAAVLCTGKGWKHSLIPAAVLCAALLCSLIPGFSDWAGAQSGEVQRMLHSHQYETKYTTLPEGRLEPLKQSDATALIVTLEKPEVLYLRGFTGAEFREGRWEPLNNQILAEDQELLYWLNSREFDLRAQFEAAASVLETAQNPVTVQNVGACSAYRYIPFSVRSDDGFVPEALTDTAAGERYDSFTTVYNGASMLPELLAALEETDSRYLQAEAAYREFVNAHYLAVPDELAEEMKPYWDKAEGMDAQAAVKAVLERCYPDGIRHDPFYATAAVLTLRHFGIPARYAEGYILPRITQTTVELNGSHAACWAEVYQEGVGWIPMELTDGPEEESEQLEEQPLPPDQPQETLPPETEPVSEPEPEGGYRVRIAAAILWGAVLTVVLLALAVLLLLLRRRYILKKRRALLDQPDVREGITWAFADSIGLLERMGIRRGIGSLEKLELPVRKALGAEFAEQFLTASRIHGRALFSTGTMTEEEREAVLCFRSAALEALRGRSGRLSRLWMKYILCLF